MSNPIFEYEHANNELARAQRLQLVATTNMVEHCKSIFNKMTPIEKRILEDNNFTSVGVNRLMLIGHVDSERDAVTVLRIMYLYRQEILS